MTQERSSHTSRDTEIGLAEASPFLERKLDKISRQHFDGTIQSTIAWGIPLTSYCLGERPDAASPVPAAAYHVSGVIVIHPMLRDKAAPQYVYEYLIFHECLHEIFPVPAGQDPHPPELMAWEADAPKKEQAKQWLAKQGFPVLR